MYLTDILAMKYGIHVIIKISYDKDDVGTHPQFILKHLSCKLLKGKIENTYIFQQKPECKSYNITNTYLLSFIYFPYWPKMSIYTLEVVLAQ